jgi:glycine betaine/proline transport system substrate-binding protein
MRTILTTTFAKTAMGAALSAAVVTAGLTGPAQAQDKTVKIGWVAWSSTEMTTQLAKQVIEQEHGYDVELVLSDAGALYQGEAGGSIDASLVSWRPETHADYVEKTELDIVNLGILYGYAKLGWIVPEYIPEDQLSSIADLKSEEVQEKLDGVIQGIDPGAGLTRLSEKALKDYELDDYRLRTASGAAMTAALKRATRNEDWIVVTGWSPHWKFGAYDLRYLEDPKGSLGKIERNHVIARQGLYQDHPEVALTLNRMFLDIEVLQGLMYEAQETSYEEAAKKFVENNPERVDFWAHNEVAGDN